MATNAFSTFISNSKKKLDQIVPDIKPMNLRVNLPKLSDIQKSIPALLERERIIPQTTPKIRQNISNTIASVGVPVGRVISKAGNFITNAPQNMNVPTNKVPLIFDPLKQMQVRNKLISPIIGGQVSDVGVSVERASTPEGRKLLVESGRQVPGQVRRAEFGNLLNNPAIVAGLAIPDVTDIGTVVGRQGLKVALKEGGEQSLKAGVGVLDDIAEGFGKAGKIKQAERSFVPTAQQFRKEFLNTLAPIYDFVDKSGKTLAAEENPFKLLSVMKGIGGEVVDKLEMGLGPVLQNNFKLGRSEDLRSLLVLDRNNEVLNNGLKTRYSKEQLTNAYKVLETKYGAKGFAELQESAKQVVDYGRGLLSELKDAGIIDDVSFNRLNSRGQFYVPFQVIDHISDGLEKGNFGSSSFNVASQNVIKAMKGSDMQVADPIEALVERTGKVMSLVERNKAMQALVGLRVKDPEVYGGLITPFSKGVIPKGQDTVNVFINGKNQKFLMPKEIASALKGIDAKSADILTSTLGVSAKLLKAGATTLNMGFIPVNAIRDLPDAVFSEFASVGPKAAVEFALTWPQALLSAARKDDIWRQWVRNGGAQSTFISQIVNNSPKTVAQLSGQQPPLIKRVLKTPVEVIKEFGRIAEEATRVNRFKRGLARGESPLEAAFQSRDFTIDFAKSGNTVKLLNQVVPFLNAGIQGSAKMVDLYKKNPKRAIVGASLLGGFPALSLFMHNKDFQDYKDIPQYEKEGNWIILARDRTQLEKLQGKDIIGYKIPKPFFVKPIANTTEAMLDYVNGTSPDTLAQIGLGILGDTSPIGIPGSREFFSKVTPPALKAGIEGVTNTNLFTGAPIVPQSLQGVKPSEQYKKNTPSAFVKAGQLTGISPLQLQNATQTMFGGVGRQVAELLSGNVKEGTVGQLSRRFIGVRSGQDVDRQYDLVSNISQSSKTESLQLKREAEKTHLEIKNLGKGKSAQAFIELTKTNPKLAQEVADIARDEELGLTPLDRSVKALGVEDGSRAKFVFQSLEELDSKEAKRELWKSFVDKKILTPEVAQQVQYLLDNPEKGKVEKGGIIENIFGSIRDAIVPEVGASDVKGDVLDIKVVGDNIETTYKDSEGRIRTASEHLDRDQTILQTIGGIFHKVGTKVKAKELRISENLGYVPREEKIKAVERMSDDLKGYNQPGGKNDPFVQKGWVLDPDGVYRKPENSIKNDVKELDEEVIASTRSTGPGVATQTKYNEDIKKVFGDDWVDATRVLSRKLDDGRVVGENNDLFGTPEEDPAGQNTDRTNPNNTIDRGLFRINSVHFFNEGEFNRRKEKMAAAEIDTSSPEVAWNEMLTPEGNIAMAKIIFDEQGWDAWFAAPKDLLSEREIARREAKGIPILARQGNNKNSLV